MSAAFLEAIHADPWTEDFVDLAALNAGASEAIEGAVNRLRTLARSQPHALRSTSMVVLGPPGAGKTHLFARLRRRFGPRAVFVHIRPLVHAEMTPRFVLGETVRQLGYTTHGLPQINALVGSLLAHLNGEDTSFPSTFLSEYQSLPDSERETKLEEALERVLGTWKEADESFLRRLLHAPFVKGAQQRALLSWLSGRDCDVAQLQRIGATASLTDEVCPAALRSLSAVAALGAPIVLVFDQLENLVEAGGSDARIVAYANLAAELVDSMRGLLLVHMALDTEWSRAIEPSLNLSQKSRLLMARQTLALPSPKEREELLRLWIDKLPEREGAFPWPLGEARLERIRRELGMTPRMLLMEFRRALEGDEQVEPTRTVEPGAGLADEWQQRLAAARKLLDEASEQRACADPARIVDGILACGGFLPGAKLRVNAAKETAQLLLDDERGVRQVAFLAQASHRSLGAALNKLTAVAARHPVIAIRERARDLPPTWKDTLKRRASLLATGRARWIELDREDAAKLLALDELLQCARSGDITDERGQPITQAAAVEWIRSTLEVGSWEIMRELVATPPPAEEVEDETSPGPAAAGLSLTILTRLRLASLDRVVREATRIDPRATRGTVLNELEAAKSVRWFGRNIVCVRIVP